MSRKFTTDADIRADVDQALQCAPGYPADYDIDGIVREIIERVGIEGYADLPHDEFWWIVARHDDAIADEQAIDMDEVCRLLSDVYGVENVQLLDTGGGCATIYAGPTVEVPDYGPRSAVCAGPGFFQHHDAPSLGWVGDFCWGNDDEEMTGAVYAKDVCDDPSDAAEIAWRMAQWLGETGGRTVTRKDVR